MITVEDIINASSFVADVKEWRLLNEILTFKAAETYSFDLQCCWFKRVCFVRDFGVFVKGEYIEDLYIDWFAGAMYDAAGPGRWQYFDLTPRL